MVGDNKPPEGVDEDKLREWFEHQRRVEQHDLLWWALGWLPTTLKNRVAIVAVIGLAVFIGGQDFLSNLTAFLGGLVE